MPKKTNTQTKNDSNTKKTYSIEEASGLIKSLSTSKFVGKVDIDIHLNLSEKQKKDTISGNVILPHQFNKEAVVAVIADGEDQAKAKAAGADIVGYKELIKDIEDGKVEFDVLIATPTVMRDLARLGKILGPRNMMPTPKNETVTADVEKSIKSFKAGKLTFKSTDQHSVRSSVARVDMDPAAIAENISTFVKAAFEEAKKLNPQPFKHVIISPTMGKGLKLDVSSIIS